MLATNDNSSIKSSDLSNLMAYCYGTEHYYTNPIYSFKYTDGVKVFCEKVQSYWLLDIVKGWGSITKLTVKLNDAIEVLRG